MLTIKATKTSFIYVVFLQTLDIKKILFLSQVGLPEKGKRVSVGNNTYNHQKRRFIFLANFDRSVFMIRHMPMMNNNAISKPSFS
ncbi:hypothetical protein NADFUDRAFT_44755 [Nadsonia fulvescens var. elongata DSM 6958]|uniref:Uncharacterized protein n=1 Tax=Nadsonia fulvescens var. elongata DSM 6958 TaxID=857566 RepID=A0A1E3PT37_9ASCO|nr:hypothetical protein NADFUDRAFT_44755 [Nadsonia fulvescens var. elongata DSM 6958]